MPYTHLSDKQIGEICSLYLQGSSLTSLIKRFHVTFVRLRKILIKNSISLRSVSQQFNLFPQKRILEDEVLSSNAVILWSLGYESGPKHTRAFVQCPDCKEVRKVFISRNRNWTGRCQECSRRLKYGRNSKAWKGGYQKSGKYLCIHLDALSPQDFALALPMCQKRANHNTVLEHRLVMARYLGRPLLEDEIVHHLNGIKCDNRLCNLQIVSKNTHRQKEETRYQILQSEIRRLQILLENNNIFY